jgi:hypothetical protein
MRKGVFYTRRQGAKADDKLREISLSSHTHFNLVRFPGAFLELEVAGR